ncbi:hypothetical protein [Streptomyces salinarius]|uniref:hypothetical protein n=1 Tax=Streptomyces salinarius TaxID=2762598 RepID=UPI0016467728|nr:hypothetical protein [Streptomyces salinarius]
MGLTAVLTRAAARRPRVLLVTTPGGTPVRLAAERELRSRDWPSAATPAGADLMLVAGPDCARWDPALDRLWRDMPRPCARVRAVTADGVASVLDAGRTRLGTRGGPDGPDGPEGEGVRARPAEGDTDVVEDGRTGHGHGHDHGHGGMEMPGGLPMAGPGEDRDGLTLDRLHVPLGPFLADWPAGLTLRVVLQGDVVQRADLDEPAADEPAAGGPGDPFWSRPWIRAAAGEPVGVGEAARRRAAAHLDSLGRLLAVAGWPAEAVTARRLRDDLLDGAPASSVLPRVERFARRVGRSRTLYWLTRGLGLLSAADARAAGVTGPAVRAAGGDVPARYRQWLTEVVDAVRQLDATGHLDPDARESPRGRWDAERPPSAALAVLLPRLLVGAELGAARLVVASLDPDPDELAAGRPAVTRG